MDVEDAMSTKPLPPIFGGPKDTKPLPPIFWETGGTKPLPPILWETKSTEPLALIIEDDELLAAALADALRALEFETEIAVDGKQALSLLDEVVPWIVVLDLHLPIIPGSHSLRHTGMGVLYELQKNSRLTETRIIIATGDARAAEHLSGQADLVLVKPFTCSQLQDLVTRMASWCQPGCNTLRQTSGDSLHPHSHAAAHNISYAEGSQDQYPPRL
jgi:DNA-binding response OmpR family regulator